MTLARYVLWGSVRYLLSGVDELNEIMHVTYCTFHKVLCLHLLPSPCCPCSSHPHISFFSPLLGLCTWYAPFWGCSSPNPPTWPLSVQVSAQTSPGRGLPHLPQSKLVPPLTPPSTFSLDPGCSLSHHEVLFFAEHLNHLT